MTKCLTLYVLSKEKLGDAKGLGLKGLKILQYENRAELDSTKPEPVRNDMNSTFLSCQMH